MNSILLPFLFLLFLKGVESAPVQNQTKKNASCIYVSDMLPALESAIKKCQEELKLPDLTNQSISEKFFENITKNNFDDQVNQMNIFNYIIIWICNLFFETKVP